MAATKLTLSSFCKCDIIRTGNIAEIVVAYADSAKRQPIRLIGFKTDAGKTNYEIAEEGFAFYQRLVEKINSRKP